METFNIHETKTHLSRLVERAAKGEAFVIAKAGKPLVKVTAIDAPEPSPANRMGFLVGQVEVPDAATFNSLGQDEIAAMFGLGE